MKYLMLFGVSFLVMACAMAQKTSVVIGQSPLIISQGEVRWLEFPLPKNEARLICRGSDVKYVKKDGLGLAFVMESYFSDFTPFSCKVESQGVVTYEFLFNVKERDYFAEVLKVDPKKIKLSPKAEIRVAAEQIVLNKIYASSPSEFLFTESFMRPLDSHVTSVYGNKRVYNGKKKGQHLGIDYRASIGDKVPAANAGKVVFSGDLFFTGWTVIIDHGMDIFTVYGHLSKTLVPAGETVKRGELIGLSGNTGRTSGPHLHWGTKVQGQYIDGFILVEESKKYFKN
jgi:murein DD-endopeptidase MepM/ murein hydrolase activator NlpD